MVRVPTSFPRIAAASNIDCRAAIGIVQFQQQDSGWYVMTTPTVFLFSCNEGLTRHTIGGSVNFRAARNGNVLAVAAPRNMVAGGQYSLRPVRGHQVGSTLPPGASQHTVSEYQYPRGAPTSLRTSQHEGAERASRSFGGSPNPSVPILIGRSTPTSSTSGTGRLMLHPNGQPMHVGPGPASSISTPTLAGAAITARPGVPRGVQRLSAPTTWTRTTMSQAPVPSENTSAGGQIPSTPRVTTQLPPSDEISQDDMIPCNRKCRGRKKPRWAFTRSSIACDDCLDLDKRYQKNTQIRKQQKAAAAQMDAPVPQVSVDVSGNVGEASNSPLAGQNQEEVDNIVIGNQRQAVHLIQNVSRSRVGGTAVAMQASRIEQNQPTNGIPYLSMDPSPSVEIAQGVTFTEDDYRRVVVLTGANTVHPDNVQIMDMATFQLSLELVDIILEFPFSDEVVYQLYREALDWYTTQNRGGDTAVEMQVSSLDPNVPNNPTNGNPALLMDPAPSVRHPQDLSFTEEDYRLAVVLTGTNNLHPGNVEIMDMLSFQFSLELIYLIAQFPAADEVLYKLYREALEWYISGGGSR
jgi:hypothetical protein